MKELAGCIDDFKEMKSGGIKVTISVPSSEE